MGNNSARGSTAYHSGLAAEDRIAADYRQRGFIIAQRRWRGTSGEIDLIARNGEGLVFIEVKKSRSFDRAAEALSRRQIQRIVISAEEFLASEPDGQLTNIRFDVALVDAAGTFQILENAFDLT